MYTAATAFIPTAVANINKFKQEAIWTI